MEEKKLQKVIGTCKQAELVFNLDTSFGLYLDFNINDKDEVNFYITDYHQVKLITDYLNREKTGLSKRNLDNEILKELIGEKALLLVGRWGENCFFLGFHKDLQVIQK